MNNLYMIVFRCFLIGILASSSFGPIFILTFNRGAIYGLLKGIATAIGACLADGLYFFLGLVGVLAVLQESKQFMFFVDTIGGVLLILLGIHSLQKARKGVNYICLESKSGVCLTALKSFVLTILNPLVLFFFMVIGVQILPPGVSHLNIQQIFLCSVMVAVGSFSVLAVVALIASLVGGCISEKKLKILSLLTGLIFIGVGIYFLGHLL